jgi:phosphoribulokinase
MNTSLKKRLLDTGKSILIGVAGDSGAGKSTFTKGIISLLGKNLVSTFSTDDYHKEDREQRTKSGRLPLDPNVNHLDLLTRHLEELKEGKSVVKPVYNHKTGMFDPDIVFKPTPIIIVEGLHPYYTNKLKGLVDFKVFVDPSRRVKYVWKIRRDMDKRGAQPERIKEEVMAREPMYRQYVDPQKLSADIVVGIHTTKFYVNPVLQLEEQAIADKKRDQYRLDLIQQLLDYPIDQAVLSFGLQELLEGERKPFRLEYYHDVYYGRKVTVTILDGEMHRKVLEPLERHLLEHMGRKERIFMPSREREYMNAVEIAQLFVCWRFIEKLDFLLRE